MPGSARRLTCSCASADVGKGLPIPSVVGTYCRHKTCLMDSWTGMRVNEFSMLLPPVGVGTPKEIPGFVRFASFPGCLVCIVSHFRHCALSIMILALRTRQYRRSIACSRLMLTTTVSWCTQEPMCLDWAAKGRYTRSWKQTRAVMT